MLKHSNNCLKFYPDQNTENNLKDKNKLRNANQSKPLLTESSPVIIPAPYLEKCLALLKVV